MDPLLANWIEITAYVLGGWVVGAGALGALAWRHRSARRQTELCNRVLFQHSGTALIHVNRSNKIVRVNDAFEKLASMGRQEMEGRRGWLEFFDDTQRTALSEAHGLRQRYAYAAPAHCEAIFLDKLRQRHQVELCFGKLPAPGEWLIAVNDLTPHKRALAEARQAEARYRDLFENATLGIFQTTPDGKYLNANAALARLYGYADAAELRERLTNIEQQLYVDASQRRLFMEQIHRDGFVRDFESQVSCKDGSRIWIVENAREVRDEQGRLLYYEGMVEDISERHRHELTLRDQNVVLEQTIAELETAQSTLVEQERLRALGQMASGIAHDFNNTLSPILGFSELLLKRPKNMEDPEKVRRYVEMIHTSAKDATHVVRCLREFYRLHTQTEQGVQVQLHTLAQQCVQLTEPRWRNQAQADGIQIHVETDLPAVPAFFGTESALREALTNLIFNAVDAMPRGGTLRLATQGSADTVSLSVSDTGCGMPPEVRKRCLDPFFTTKGSGGTGLGLSMVYGIVMRHGGTIDIQSEVNQGTTFTLTFPLTQRVRTKAPHDDAESIASDLRVLLMEDDPLVREVLTEYLRGDGCDVSAAVNGREGLALYEPGRFDLVLTDKSMPELCGDQVAAEIKKREAGLPIVMLTGFGDMMEAVGEQPIGVDYIISKPVTLNALRDIIAQVQANHFSSPN